MKWSGQKKSKKLAHFLLPILALLNPTIATTFHHNLTTKTPPKNAPFCHNPLQKSQQIRQKMPPTPLPIFFCNFPSFHPNERAPPGIQTYPKSKIKSHEPLFCCRKRDNGDVAHRSAVEPVPGAG
jgi:hypothetical protein